MSKHNDAVNHPSHYTAFPVEVIEIIKAALGPDGFRAYCFGNEIKYRMRAGLKGLNALEDVSKAMTYKQFREDADKPSMSTRPVLTRFSDKWNEVMAQEDTNTIPVPQRVDAQVSMDDLREIVMGEKRG